MLGAAFQVLDSGSLTRLQSRCEPRQKSAQRKTGRGPLAQLACVILGKIHLGGSFPQDPAGQMLHPWELQLRTGLAEQPRRERLLCSVAQSCPAVCDCMDSSPPCFSVHGMLQAKVLEWVAISSSRRSSRLGSNSRLLHWQADSLPPSHRGSPRMVANLKFVLKTQHG